jgi:ABC-type branched-subunit amino acid transport system substrate-binding protein
VSSQGLDSLSGPNPAIWFFTTSSTSAQQAQVEVEQVTRVLGGSIEGKTIAFVGLSSPSVDVTYDLIKQLVEENGGINGSGERTASAQIASFTAQAANLVASNPDAIITVDSTANTVIVAKALNDAGYTGPLTSSTGANDDVMLANVNLPNLYVPRAYNQAKDSEVMLAAAEGAGVEDQTENAFFGQGYAAGVALVAGLDKCGFPCSATDLPLALQSVGQIDIGDAGFGPLEFSDQRHYGVTAMQFFTWDDAAKKSVPNGDPIPVD